MRKGKIVGYTTGVFDLFHIGHLNILKKSKELCDYLIVGVSTDKLVYEYKNKYPVIPYEERAEILKSIKYVDEVVPQTDMDKYKAWKELRYDVLFHGDDWKESKLYADIQQQLNAEGVKVVFFPYTQGTSSTIIKKFLYSNVSGINKLNYAVDYAIHTGAFHALNLIEGTDEFCVWGAGDFFCNNYERLFKNRNIHIKYIVDSDVNKQNQIIVDGIKCISPQRLCELSNPVVLPFVYNGFNEICRFCAKEKIRWIHRSHFLLDMQDIERRNIDWFISQKNKILQVYELLEDDASKETYVNAIFNRIAHGYELTDYANICSIGEYFAPSGNLYRLNGEESFLDVGAFDGDTILRYLNAVNNEFFSIHAVEMSNKNYQILIHNIEQLPQNVKKKIFCYNYGAWNESTQLFCGDEEEHTGIACSINKGKRNFLGKGEIELSKCDTLDHMIGDNRVTLIKMDIEGAEVNALQGARNIITMQRPKLAICVYHNLSDYWEIPILLKKMVPEYHLGLRHHSMDNGGTVCYAWV